MLSISVIIPTYNEASCIDPLFERLSAVSKETSADFEVVIMDDNSPDGTAKVAREAAERHRLITQVNVRKSDPGLSQSVVDGFREATGDVCVVMDADLQHPPERIPDFVAAVENGADIVVGSRSLDDGEYGDWSQQRQLISKGADFLSHLAIPSARDVSDRMSGFFAVRREVIDPDELDPRGFKILLEVISKNPDLETTEIGFEFGVREKGESKFSLGESIKFVEHLLMCRISDSPVSRILEPQRVVKMMEFGFIGAIGVLVNMVVFMGLLAVPVHFAVAGFSAFLVAVQWNFVGNYLLTFDETDGNMLKQYARFHAVSVGGLVVYQVALAFSLGLLTFPPSVSNLFAIGFGSVWNFVGAERIAFGALN